MSYTTIFATAAAAGEAAPQPNAFAGMLPIIIVFGVMIFFMMRSQKKQQQKQQQMLDRIVKGSRVLLNCGIYGKVVEVREKTLLVELADSMTPVEVIKSAVAGLPEENAAAGDAKKA